MDYYDEISDIDLSQIDLNPADFVSGLQDLWSFVTSSSPDDVNDDYEDVIIPRGPRIIEEPVYIAPAPASKSKKSKKSASTAQSSTDTSVPSAASKSKKATNSAGVMAAATGSAGGGPAKGKKAKKVPGAPVDIKWGDVFSICGILSSAQFSKYPIEAQKLITNLPAMKDSTIGRELMRYMNATKDTSLLTFLSIFSRKENYPPYYLKLILDSIPKIKYNYIPWTGTEDVFENINKNELVISNQTLGGKCATFKQDVLTHTYSPVILSVLFDVIARYRYTYGDSSPKLLKISDYKDQIGSYKAEFTEIKDKLSCPSYTVALLNILEEFPSCREGVDNTECPYEIVNLNILRKLIYKCIGNINKLKLTFSESDQQEINYNIQEELSKKGLTGSLNEREQLKKTLIVFQKYSENLSAIYKVVERSATIITAENAAMLKQLPHSTIRTSAILFLALLIRALREGNSDFIENLSDEQLGINEDASVYFVNNDGGKLLQTNNLQIEMDTKDLLDKHLPKTCNVAAAKGICATYQEARALKLLLSDKKIPVPGSKSGTLVDKAHVKKADLSDSFNLKIMNNLAIQTASLPLTAGKGATVSYTTGLERS